MIRIRTNRGGWRDVYLSPIASARLQRAEPQQDRPYYEKDGVLYCQLAATEHTTRRQESIWLLADFQSATPHVIATLMPSFASEYARTLAHQSISGSSPEAEEAERQLARMAAMLDLPSRIPSSTNPLERAVLVLRSCVIALSVLCLASAAALGWCAHRQRISEDQWASERAKLVEAVQNAIRSDDVLVRAKEAAEIQFRAILIAGVTDARSRKWQPSAEEIADAVIKRLRE